MAKKGSRTISTGGGNYFEDVKVKGDFVVGNKYTGSNLEDIEKLFESIYSKIENRSNTSPAIKNILKTEVVAAKEEAKKIAETSSPEKADKGMLMHHLQIVGQMAPDILEVTLTTLGNPLMGIKMVVDKISQKMKADAKTKQS